MDDFIRRVLAEDLGEAGDVTSQATIPEGRTASATLVARARGCVSGLRVAEKVFQAVGGGTVTTDILVREGATVLRGDALLTVRGNARAILSAERVALNLVGHLSGVATATRELSDLVEHTRARVIDTRKTTPGLRALEKAAVVHGGGANHRMGLYDAVLIKDNHIAVVGSVAEAVRAARAHVGDSMPVEVEVEQADDVESAIEAGADIVLLDNMPPDEMRRAVELAGGRCTLEASGGITRETIVAVAESGVDTISVGWITHSAPALDVALDFGDPSGAGVPTAE